MSRPSLIRQTCTIELPEPEMTVCPDCHGEGNADTCGCEDGLISVELLEWLQAEQTRENYRRAKRNEEHARRALELVDHGSRCLCDGCAADNQLTGPIWRTE